MILTNQPLKTSVIAVILRHQFLVSEEFNFPDKLIYEVKVNDQKVCELHYIHVGDGKYCLEGTPIHLSIGIETFIEDKKVYSAIFKEEPVEKKEEILYSFNTLDLSIVDIKVTDENRLEMEALKESEEEEILLFDTPEERKEFIDQYETLSIDDVGSVLDEVWLETLGSQTVDKGELFRTIFTKINTLVYGPSKSEDGAGNTGCGCPQCQEEVK